VSPVELTQAHLDRIDALNPRLAAFITVTSEKALASARKAERDLRAGDDKGSLHGIPIAVKDLVFTRGIRTTGGSRATADYVPDEDATVVRRLADAGAVPLGKLNLSEFGMGGTIDHPFGTPCNPWNTDHSPGSSSSGSGAAVAAGLCAGALGSDTGGSVRGPASFCGIVGIRPTFGRVSRHGAFPMSWTMDTIGPMTRTVEDCAIMLRAIAGRDIRDSATSDAPVPDYLASIDEGVEGLRIGLPREMFEFEGLDGEMRDAVTAAAGVLEAQGASVEEVSLPTSAYSGAVLVAIVDVDAASVHTERLRANPEDYDWNSRTRLEMGSLVPATAYLKAQKARALIRLELLDALERRDVLIMPTISGPAPPNTIATGRPEGYYQGKLDLGRRRYISPASLGGLPSLSVPCGFSESGLPLGMQIIGRPFDEALLFGVGHAYEQATQWHDMHPPL
jgi:aspartyl-tRNA(Asn)/glutamyl-tRNA(Gln) amidotransferase subunit A